MSNGNNKRGNNFFFFDINMTTRCNLRCKYCIEPFKENKDLPDDILNKLFDRMKEFLNSDFMKQYDGITFGMWGGEPTINSKSLEKLIRHYAADDRVRFLIYSNGYKINHVKHIIEEFKNIRLPGGSPKIYYQISYDGYPAHTVNRLSVSGGITVEEVRDSIKWAVSEKIPFGIKSTINRDTFKIMDECYLDVRDMMEGQNSTYFPTIDYLTNINISEEEKKKFYKDLEKSLINIAEKEITYYKKHKRFFFSWFYDNMSICAAGSHGLAMDIDGTIYKCHGTFYSDKKEDNKVTTIFNDSFLEDIEKSSNIHRSIFRVLPEECKSCYAEFCLKCNSMCYEISEKETFMEKWNDYPNQPEICDLYKLATKVKWGMQKVLGIRK